MLIRIISNTVFGYHPLRADGTYDSIVIPTTRKDPPIEVLEADAIRLVEAGIAEIVDGEASEKAPKAAPAVAEDPEEATETVYTTNMKSDDLKAAMAARGLPIKGNMSKKAMAEALNASDLPDLQPQDVIE